MITWKNLMTVQVFFISGKRIWTRFQKGGCIREPTALSRPNPDKNSFLKHYSQENNFLNLLINLTYFPNEFLEEEKSKKKLEVANSWDGKHPQNIVRWDFSDQLVFFKCWKRENCLHHNIFLRNYTLAIWRVISSLIWNLIGPKCLICHALYPVDAQ